MTRKLTTPVAALVLLFLLPLFGVGGQAWAGFSNYSTETREGTSWKAVLADFLVDANATTTSSSSRQDISPTDEPTPTPLAFPTHHQADPAATGGMGSSGASGVGVSGAISIAYLDPRLDLFAEVRGGRLFLAEQRCRLHPLASRLFRPPRFIDCHTV